MILYTQKINKLLLLNYNFLVETVKAALIFPRQGVPSCSTHLITGLQPYYKDKTWVTLQYCNKELYFEDCNAALLFSSLL